ncbi:Uncharacterised protein [Bordetella pertussis]|nr:Uncharacterised protein [Bordetella pertussis]
MKLLRAKPRWIQDKGAVLSVLLRNAAARSTSFVSRRIDRERLTRVPADAPVERLPQP